jgi:hypothetical protein
VNERGVNGMARKNWTELEVNYLEESWGAVSLGHMSRKLNRSVSSVVQKARRLGLKDALHSGDFITYNQLMKALGRGQVSSYTDTSWVKNRNFPIQMRTMVTQKVRCVNLEKFWKWAEQNRTFVDFSKVEVGALGLEPEWVKEQRKNDHAMAKGFKNTPWTLKDDTLLKSLVEMFRYTYREISIRLQRTEIAIKTRLLDLGIKARPLKAGNHNKWTKEEETVLWQLISQGCKPEIIAEHLPGRSAIAIRGKIERETLKGGERVG